jgi:streptogrisin C
MVTAATLAIGSMTATGPVVAAPNSTLTPSERQALNHVGLSVNYLMTHYGVSTKEALRRMRLQEDSDRLAKQLVDSSPDTYAGMWIDQAHGGILMVGSTRPTDLRSAIARFPDRNHVKTYQTSRSFADLQALKGSIDTELHTNSYSSIQAGIDAVHNTVTVTLPAEIPSTAANTTSAIVQRYHGAVSVRRAPKNADDKVGYSRTLNSAKAVSPDSAEDDCNPVTCAPNMRGGLRLDIQRDDGTYGGCTNGYNIYDDDTGKPYILTAGHCVMESNHSHVDHPIHNGINVATEQQSGGFESDGFPLDFALMPFDSDNESYWLDQFPSERYQIHEQCVTVNANGPCVNHELDVSLIDPYGTGSGHPVGTVVCATGSSSTSSEGPSGWVNGTRCGEITSLSGGVYTTNICSRKGDSGGPMFQELTTGTASGFGVLHDGTDTNSSTCGSSEWSEYVPLFTILNFNYAETGLNLWL